MVVQAQCSVKEVGCQLTQAHDDAIAEPLGMPHATFGLHHKVTEHLDGLGIHNLNVMLHNHVLAEELVYQLAARPPLVRVLHQQEVVAARDDAADVRGRPAAVQVRLLVYQLLDEARRRDDDGGARAELERVDPAVCLAHFANWRWVRLVGIWCRLPMIGQVGGP